MAIESFLWFVESSAQIMKVSSVALRPIWAPVEFLFCRVPLIVPVPGEPRAVGLAHRALPPGLGHVAALPYMEGAGVPLAPRTPREGAVATDVPGLGRALLALALGTLLLLSGADVVPHPGLRTISAHRRQAIRARRTLVFPQWVVRRLGPVRAVWEGEVCTEVPAAGGEGEEGAQEDDSGGGHAEVQVRAGGWSDGW